MNDCFSQLVQDNRYSFYRVFAGFLIILPHYALQIFGLFEEAKYPINNVVLKILKQSLKNYLSGLKYVFTPIGILSIFIIIGFSIIIPGIINSVNTLVDSVIKELKEIKVDWKDAAEK